MRKDTAVTKQLLQTTKMKKSRSIPGKTHRDKTRSNEIRIIATLHT